MPVSAGTSCIVEYFNFFFSLILLTEQSYYKQDTRVETKRKLNSSMTKNQFHTLSPMIIISDLEAKGNSDLVRNGNSVLLLWTSQID